MKLSNWRLVLNKYRLKQLRMQIEHAVELRGLVYRACVQTFVLTQRKKDTDIAFFAASCVESYLT